MINLFEAWLTTTSGHEHECMQKGMKKGTRLKTVGRHANQHAQAKPWHTLCNHKISPPRSGREDKEQRKQSTAMPTIGDELLTMIDRRRSEKLRSNSNLDNCQTLQQSRFLSSVRYGNSCSGLARKNTMMRMSRKFEINGIYPRPDRTSVKDEWHHLPTNWCLERSSHQSHQSDKSQSNISISWIVWASARMSLSWRPCAR